MATFAAALVAEAVGEEAAVLPAGVPLVVVDGLNPFPGKEAVPMTTLLIGSYNRNSLKST